MNVFRCLRALRGPALIAASLMAGAAAWAADNAPIRILVGFPPGGGSDVIARVLADQLKDRLGVPVLVENKAGAGGKIAAQALKAASADGHTLFLTHDHTISILPLVTKDPGFDPDQDFVPVAGFATFVNGLAVAADTPARSVADYVAWVKNQGGGKATIGVPAPASVPEFLVQLIGQKYDLDLQASPYRDSDAMIAAMLGNQIAAGVGSVPDFIENHKTGKIRVIAVMGKQRQRALPDVPTFSELGVKGFDELPYYGLYAPAGTPQAQIVRIADALLAVLALPEVRTRLAAMGLNVNFMTPRVLNSREQAYTQAWTWIIKTSGFKPQ